MLAVASHATAVPVPAVNLPDLIDRSDLIVTGTVTALYDDGPATIKAAAETIDGRTMLADLSIDALVKGWAGGTVRVRFTKTEQFIGYASVSQNSYRMFFLRRTADEYIPVSPYFVSTIAIAGFRLKTSSPVERAAEVLAA